MIDKYTNAHVLDDVTELVSSFRCGDGRRTEIIARLMQACPTSPPPVEKMHLELRRIYALPDRWLAEELLRLARHCREEFAQRLKAVDRNANYECSFVWDVVPEISKRLGSRSLTLHEASDPMVAGCDNSVLREYAGICLRFSALADWVDITKAASATALLVRPVWIGNPVAIALDRLAPPDIGTPHRDLITRQMREWSRANGLSEIQSWRPDADS